MNRPAIRRAHLIGVAGSGMRALAEVLLAGGWQLSGSDLTIDSLAFLAEAGASIHQGHAREHLPPETGLVVHSDAVAADNPELRRAAELGIPVRSYFEMLALLGVGKHTLAVAGTHGKSSTTAMAAAILVAAGRDPTVLCGAAPLGQASGGRAGSSDLMLVEACEYRANFLRLQPRHAVILGIEPDHFDCYDSADQLAEAFRRFARSLPPDGLLLARHDCPVTRRIAEVLPCRVETFGIAAEADWSARRLSSRRGRYTFEIHHHGGYVCGVSLQAPGRHNVVNALAAAALARENLACQGDRRRGREIERVISRALRDFRGLHRRMELRGVHRGVAVIDDYAHHPTEVAAALATVHRMFPGRRVWCVFQPHQASRTERLLDETAQALQNADNVLIAEIFRAREGPARTAEVTAADLARAVRHGGAEAPEPHAAEAIARLLENSLAPGDVLVTMGAGDIGRIADGFIDSVERFRENRTAG